jgi:hypothetical protein
MIIFSLITFLTFFFIFFTSVVQHGTGCGNPRTYWTSRVYVIVTDHVVLSTEQEVYDSQRPYSTGLR